MKKAVTILCVYSGDHLCRLEAAVKSVYEQDCVINESIEHKLLIYRDGPVSEDINSFLKKISMRTDTILMKSDQNMGLATGLNTLLTHELVKAADYLFRMDADDISMHVRYSMQIKYLELEPQISLIGTSVTEFNATSSNLRIASTCHDTIIRHLTYKSPIFHPTVCFNLKSIKLCDLHYCASANGYEDLKLWQELAAKGYRFANLRDPLLKFRYSNDTLIRRSNILKIFGEVKQRTSFTLSMSEFHFIEKLKFSILILLRFFGQLLPLRLKKIMWPLLRGMR